jgi:GNAT superfamily N-acetyltransferase
LTVTITDYTDHHAADFKRLNLEWLEGFGLLEDGDFKHLDHPREGIIDKGGAILLAVEKGEVVGTCAILPSPYSSAPDVFEMVKLAVTRRAQGRGVGRALAIATIERAREMGATRIELLTASRLTAALRLYESLGFTYGPLPADPGYATTDTFMTMKL